MKNPSQESSMDALRRGWARLRAFFRKQPLDRELEEEIASHIAMATEENLHNGMSPDEARRKAMVKFGGVEQAKEKQRESRGLPWLERVLQDLRYALRSLSRDRGFATVAILILALGIGANVVVFSVVNTILLRPLPFYDPSRLVWIAPDGANGLSASTYSVDAYEDLRSMNKSYEDVTGYFAFSTEDNYKLTGRGVPLPVTGIMVTGNFFHVLGVEPMFGRQFTPEESIKGGPAAVMLTYPFWQRQFGGDRSIVGKTIELDNKPVTVAGILPESFDFGAAFSPGARVDVLTPLIMDDIRYDGNTIAIIGRLKPGVTIEQSRIEARTLFPQFYWGKRFPDSKNNYTAYPVFLKDYISGKMRRSLIVLWSAVGLILLIVCVNLANLLLARAAARSKEFALRSALGAGRRRLIGQVLTESLVLAAGGAALGLALAYGLLRYLAHQGSIALPLLSSVRLDGTALIWTLLITVSTAVLFGLVPGIKVSRTNVQEALKDGGHGTTEGRQHETMRTTLVISEVALACVLLVGAGLLLRSFLHVLDVDLGFEPSTAAAVRIDYDDGGKTDKRSAILQNIANRVSSLPGVDAVGFSDNLPLDRNRSWGGPRIKGKTYKPGEGKGAFVYIVSPGYMKAMGMHLRGRDFTWQDNDNSEGAVILNESAAKELWPNEDAVGKMAVIGKKDVRVIGVIADVRDTSVEGKVSWQMYLPMMQKDWGPDGAVLVLRSKLPPEQLAGSVMRTLRDINPNQAAVEFRPMQRLVEHALSPRQFFMLLVGIFAGLGLLLASLGIYGVISYSVTRRTQEIGVRMALGASPGNVQMGVLTKTLRMTAVGIAVGAVVSLAVANLIASLLFGTRPTDPMTFIAMTIVLGVVAALAGYLPARRASRINPMVALRNE
ncbi:ABC transporter permease [Edaphobacter flagellatus]|uniref:ABC transporter permease n=1 Tax=Edaphobacter flagellatus TaxID=1933044 RepID=UPI0021B1E3E3|nr:ABC transporter permease [Edaphobacter flagellatus]